MSRCGSGAAACLLVGAARMLAVHCAEWERAVTV